MTTVKLDSSGTKADPGLSESDLRELEGVRDYFLENDKTPFEHHAYHILSKHIKYLKQETNE